MADKKIDISKTEDMPDVGAPIAASASTGAEVAHDDHSGFHNYGGGVIIERGDKPITPWFYAFGVVILFILVGLFFGGYLSRPAETSDTTLPSMATTMQNQKDFVAMTSPYLIDMYQLPRPGGQSLTQAISSGQDVYTSYCIGCHGPNQDGAGPNAVSLNPSPRNLRDQPFMQGLSYQRIWTSIHKGVPGTAMPRWENTLDDNQIHDVICYVFSLTAPTDPKSGAYIRPSEQDLGNYISAGTELSKNEARP
jgi:mono/diheme cytochrome c family protein